MRRTILLMVVACAGCGARTQLSTDQEIVPLDGGATTPSCIAAPSAVVLHAPKSRGGYGAPELDLTGDGEHIYVVEGYAGPAYSVGGSVIGIDPCTGAAETLELANLGLPDPAFAFGGTVYAGTPDFSGMGAVDISRPSPDGGTSSIVATVAPVIATFAVDAENVYSVGWYSGIYVTPFGGATQAASSVVVSPMIPVLDDAYFYVALPQGIEKLGKQGNVVQLLFPDGATCPDSVHILRALAGDAANLYISTSAPSALWRVPKDGTTPVELTTLNDCGQITVDDTYVYFSELLPSGSGDAVIERIPKAGGAKQTVSPATYPWTIYVDSKSVYWLEVDTGIWKIDK